MSVAFAFAGDVSIVNGYSNYKETSEKKKKKQNVINQKKYGMCYAYQKQYVTNIPIISFCLLEKKPCFNFFCM